MGIGSGSDVFTSGEHSMFDALTRRCQPPYCIFDIGANKGQLVKLALETLSGKNLSMHSFEPGSEAFRFFSENLKGDRRIKLNNFGVGREKGKMVLHYNNPGSELASLTKRELDYFGIDFNQSESIEIDTIDNYCLANSIDKIHLLKIDIEGHELDALVGAKRMFSKNAIDIVTFEFGGCDIDTHSFFQNFWYFFSYVNMKLFRITPSGYFFQLKHTEKSMSSSERQTLLP